MLFPLSMLKTAHYLEYASKSKNRQPRWMEHIHSLSNIKRPLSVFVTETQ